jgi:hypothetical protein
MKLIKTIIRFFTKTTIDKPFNGIGRWQIDYNPKIINRKIDLANDDNCGTCGDFKLKKLEIIKLKQITLFLDPLEFESSASNMSK